MLRSSPVPTRVQCVSGGTESGIPVGLPAKFRIFWRRCNFVSEGRPTTSEKILGRNPGLADSVQTEEGAIAASDGAATRREDLSLASRAATGDRVALHAVVDRHARDLFRLARGLTPSAADAEDVVQDTLIAAFRGIGKFDGRASLLTWMSRILVRRAGKLGRKRSRRSAIPLDEASGEAQPPDARLLVKAHDNDCRIDLAAALPELPHEYREVIVLRELQGLSYAEIATTLGIAQGTVESRIHRARSLLRQRLHAYLP
jgi:RNA polymerase sigma-70 factor (ECF subfamily)